MEVICICKQTILFTFFFFRPTQEACLEKKINGVGFKKEINKNDDGMDWGLCFDVNSRTFDRLGVDESISLFREVLRLKGIRFV